MASYKGAFLWYEVMTSDVEGARAFYTELIGWRTQEWDEGEMPYTMWAVGERAIGGLMALPEEARQQGAPPHWMAYVGTPDVDATTRQAEQLGAKIVVPPMDIPKVGRWSLIQDPQGAMLAAYTPETAPPALPGPPEVGDISWHELATTDDAAGWKFYETLYGWNRTQTMDMGPMGPYLLFMAGEHQGGGAYRKPPEMPAPPHWLFYIRVADLDGAARRCEQLGGKLFNGPMEVPGGDRVAQCCDPQGAAFALHWKK
jgi:predicted enzyme related to lactoylglutathione lyase